MFFGIDLSITSPSICAIDENGNLQKVLFLTSKKKHFAIEHKNIEVKEYPLYEDEQDRFDKITDILINFIKKYGNGLRDKVVLEGYSYHSQSSRTYQIAENAGLLKHKMKKEKIDFEVVPPTTIKKFWTTKGNADKDKMMESYIEKKLPIDFFTLFGISKNVSPVSDMVDSIAMAYYCRENFN